MSHPVREVAVREGLGSGRGGLTEKNRARVLATWLGSVINNAGTR